MFLCITLTYESYEPAYTAGMRCFHLTSYLVFHHEMLDPWRHLSQVFLDYGAYRVMICLYCECGKATGFQFPPSAWRSTAPCSTAVLPSGLGMSCMAFTFSLSGYFSLHLQRKQLLVHQTDIYSALVSVRTFASAALLW